MFPGPQGLPMCPNRPSARRAARLCLEALESREMPAVVTTANESNDANPDAKDFVGPDGVQSLREAILEVNKIGGEITFDVAGPINVGSTLPAIRRRVTITGNTTAGGGPATAINGGGVTGGLMLQAGGTVRNLVIQGFGGVGLVLVGRGTVENNFIGTNLAGTAAVPNGGIGLSMSGGGLVRNNVISGNGGAGLYVDRLGVIVENNLIGADKSGAADLGNGGPGVQLFGPGSVVRNNVISGNGGAGVAIESPAAVGNRLLGNKIGVAADGTTIRANQRGVFVGNRARANVIGGPASADRNVIAGNTGDGVRIEQSNGNRVWGNYIGVDASGTTVRTNGDNGVLIWGGSGNAIGGTAAGAGNVIAGNGGAGVRIEKMSAIVLSPATGNVVAGNSIGLDAAGAAAVNQGGGVLIAFGAQKNKVGGSTPSARTRIGGHTAAGVRIADVGATLNKVTGNFIGSDAAGTSARPNAVGVAIEAGATANTIGGMSPNVRNVISANTGVGIVPNGVGTTKNVIAGNFIGTNATGLAALPNQGGGVAVDGANGNTIGGSFAGARNVISGNGGDGVSLSSATAAEFQGNLVFGNFIGTDATGSAAVPNAGDGVELNNVGNNYIGDRPVGRRNVISGNAGAGVHVANAAGVNSIFGNYIGTSATGLVALGNATGVLVEGNPNTKTAVGGELAGSGNLISGNQGDGVRVNDASVLVRRNSVGTDRTTKVALPNQGNGIALVNATGSLVGGTTGPNLIAFNTGDGVLLDDGAGNTVSANRIFDNDGLCIGLANGPNTNQSPPILGPITTASGIINVSGTVAGLPNQTVRLELFGNAAADGGGAGEGEVFLGTVEGVPTTAAGAFTVQFKRGVPAGFEFLCLTVTDASGNTSAFSLCQEV